MHIGTGDALRSASPSEDAEAGRHSVALRRTTERVHQVSDEAYPIPVGRGGVDGRGGGVTVSNLMERGGKEKMMVVVVVVVVGTPDNELVGSGESSLCECSWWQPADSAALVSPRLNSQRHGSVLRLSCALTKRTLPDAPCAPAVGGSGKIMNNGSCLCYNFKENFQSLVRRAAFGFEVKKRRALRSSSRPDCFLLALRNWDAASSVDALHRLLQKEKKPQKDCKQK